MTDRRDVFESAHADGLAPAPTTARPRTRRAAADTIHGRRPRLLRAALVVTVLTVGAWAVHQLGVRLAAWLHLGPVYTVALDSIQLSPSPPACLKGGRAAFLRQVGAGAGLPDAIAALEVQPADLARRFAIGSPWVEGVDEVVVEGHPPSIRVALRYRNPVAILATPRSGRIVLDRQGVVLPTDEVDLGAAGPLISLRGWTGPLDPRPGLGLAESGTAAERRLNAALRLCAFLKQKASADSSRRALVAVNLQYGERLLYAQTDQGLWVLWGEPPGRESPGELDANTKWDQLSEWIERISPDAHEFGGSYLVFTPAGPRLERHAGARRSQSGAEPGQPPG